MAKTKTKTKTKKVPARRASARRKASKAKRARKPARSTAPARPTKATAVRAQTQRKGLLREERALKRDVDNEPQRSSMSESPEYIPEAMKDSLAEELGEAAVEAASSGDQAAENIRDEDLSEEEGGPFVTTSARREFARGVDKSNPTDAEPADFPTANARRK